MRHNGHGATCIHRVLRRRGVCHRRVVRIVGRGRGSTERARRTHRHLRILHEWGSGGERRGGRQRRRGGKRRALLLLQMCQQGVVMVRDRMVATEMLRLRLNKVLIVRELMRMVRDRGWWGRRSGRMVRRLRDEACLRQHGDATSLECCTSLQRRGRGEGASRLVDEGTGGCRGGRSGGGGKALALGALLLPLATGGDAAGAMHAAEAARAVRAVVRLGAALAHGRGREGADDGGLGRRGGDSGDGGLRFRGRGWGGAIG